MKSRLFFSIISLWVLLSIACSSAISLTPMATKNKLTDTPIVIVQVFSDEVDGIAINIKDIKRVRVEGAPNYQAIFLTMDIRSSNVPFAGYDFKNGELIIEDSFGHRESAISVEPLCLLYDNETCQSVALFAISINTSQVKLYYISDTWSDITGILPIDTKDEDSIRTIALFNVHNLPFEPEAIELANISPTNTPSLTSSTLRPTITLWPTKTRTPTPIITFWPYTPGPTSTKTPTRTPIPLIIDVPGLLGKTVYDVENILGPTTAINSITDSFDPLYGGEYRDYEIGDYWFYFGFDSGDIARVFVILGGIDTKKYSPSQWARILPQFGVFNAPEPDRESSASVFWNNYKGLFIAVVGNPVYTVQIDQYRYAP